MIFFGHEWGVLPMIQYANVRNIINYFDGTCKDSNSAQPIVYKEGELTMTSPGAPCNKMD